MSYKVDWSSDYWVPGNHIYEFYKARKWVSKMEKDPGTTTKFPFKLKLIVSPPNITTTFKVDNDKYWEGHKLFTVEDAILNSKDYLIYDAVLGVIIDNSLLYSKETTPVSSGIFKI